MHLKALQKITTHPLIRLSSLNSLSVLTRVAGGFLASKMIAIFIGPSGMALTGSLRNFLTSVDTYATLGLQNGIIKYTAEYQKDREKLKEVITTTFLTIFIATLVCAALLSLPAIYWSKWVFNGADNYTWVFRTLGFILPLYIGNMIFTAALSGLGKYRQVIFLNIFGNIFGVLLSAVLIWKYGIDGAFLGLIFSPVIVLLLSCYPLYKELDGFSFLSTKYFNTALLKNLASFSLMSLVTALLGPAIYITLRNLIADHSGIAEAGFYEGINRISSFYLMFATTLLTVYFLPGLSQAATDGQVKAIFRSYYKIVVPLFSAGLLLVYLLKGFIIRVTLSQDFLPMDKLFIWQLLGDFFKVCSLILGQEFFARKMTRTYIITEITSFLVLYTSGLFLIKLYGSEGAVMAHAVTYGVYFVVLAVIFRKKLF